MPAKLSIIIPVLNDAAALEALLGQLAGVDAELVVVDGGSSDASREVAEKAGARLIHSPPGRGFQLQAGVEASHGERLWFVHADSKISFGAVCSVADASPGWGRLRLRFDSHTLAMRTIAWFMHWRSRLSGICTGDQSIWVDRGLLERVGGVPRQPLMEDIELSRRLRRHAAPQVLLDEVCTSARRWQHRGVVRTVLQMWWFRLRYFFGVSAERLAREYRSS